MANDLMSGTLSSIIKGQVESAISKGDTALASAYKTKKFDDCVSAILQGFRKLASSNCAMSGDDSLIGSAAIHWYTEDKPTIDSISAILKSGTEVLKLDTTPKITAPTPKKATVPQKATVPPKKAVVPTKPTPPPTPQVVDDDDFDID